MSKVVISNITKKFGEVEVLKGIDDTFQDGEFITLLGPSGCGKTTLLRIIAGFEKPTSGEIKIGDELVNSDNKFLPPEKRNIGMVFQSYAVWPHMSVYDNVAYPLKLKRVSKKEIDNLVNEYLEVVHLSQYKDRMPSQLSGGQQQRVALARALVSQPEILLLDEPLSNLDAKLRESMRYEIKEIQKRLGITVVFVTHDQVEAMTMSDRVLVINRGVVQQTGTPFEIYKNPANEFVADFIGKVNFVIGKVDGDRIVFDSQEWAIPYSGNLTGEVMVAMRPEDIRVSTKPTSGLKGIVERKFFMGSETECFIRIGDHQLKVSIQEHNEDKITEGQEVYLDFINPMVFEKSSEDLTKIIT